MKRKRKRINVSVSPDLYADLSSLTLRLQFRSVCSLARSMLCLILGMIHNAQVSEEEPDEKYIQELFESLGEYERERIKQQ